MPDPELSRTFASASPQGQVSCGQFFTDLVAAWADRFPFEHEEIQRQK